MKSHARSGSRRMQAEAGGSGVHDPGAAVRMKMANQTKRNKKKESGPAGGCENLEANGCVSLDKSEGNSVEMADLTGSNSRSAKTNWRRLDPPTRHYGAVSRAKGPLLTCWSGRHSASRMGQLRRTSRCPHDNQSEPRPVGCVAFRQPTKSSERR